MFGCSPSAAFVDVTALEWQHAIEPVESDWRPTTPGAQLAGARGLPTWFRIRVKRLDVPDPAVRLNYSILVEEVRQGDRRMRVRGEGGVLPLLDEQPLLVRAAAGYTLSAPRPRLGSQRALFAQSMSSEVPVAAIGGGMLVAGALLSIAGLRRQGARAYRGLGVFLFALGIIVVLNCRQLNLLIPLRGTTLLSLHWFATALYPIGFADFVLAVFGDGPWRPIGRGLKVYAAFLAASVVLHLTHVVQFTVMRDFVAFFIILFAGEGIVQAARRWREPSGRSFLVGIGVLLGFGMVDLVPTPVDFQMVPLGLLGFAVSMVLLIERQFTAARTELSHKLEALEKSNREVQELNRELRHQIAERSRHLVASLHGSAEIAAQGRSYRAGDVVGGRYMVVQRLGQGGMGAVYEVERLTDEKRFALKIMSGRISGSAAARFAREAEIAARVSDPNLVSVVDIGGVETGELFLVMELVEGKTLDDCRERFGDVAWSLTILPQIARGLRALHAAGVVHRDLKPGNVLIAGDRARIADFGISHLESAPLLETSTTPVLAPLPSTELATVPNLALADSVQLADTVQVSREVTTPAEKTGAPRSHDPQLTATGVIMGTPQYMAPEAATGAKAVRPAADMFAFGLIAFEMLMGKHAFSVAPGQLALAGLKPPPAPELSPNVPAKLAELVRACLAFDPEARPTSERACEVLA